MRMPRNGSTRWLLGIALAVVVIVVVGVVMGLVRRGDSLLPEDTPEGVVQRYILALRDGDTLKAYTYFGTALKEVCTYSLFANSSRYWLSEDVRAELVQTQSLGDGVVVKIRIVHGETSPFFGTESYSFTEEYILRREGDAWRFSEPPPPLRSCLDKGNPGLPVPAPSQ